MKKKLAGGPNIASNNISYYIIISSVNFILDDSIRKMFTYIGIRYVFIKSIPILKGVKDKVPQRLASHKVCLPTNRINIVSPGELTIKSKT